MEEKEEVKSFHLSSQTVKKSGGFGDISKKDWWKYKKMTKKEYGDTSIVLLMLAVITSIFGLTIISPALLFAGIVSGGIYLYKIIKTKFKKNK